MSFEITDLSFEISALHAAYEDGVEPQTIIAEVYRRIAAVDDPGIFIHLRGKSDVTSELTVLPSFDPEAYPLWGGTIHHKG